MKLLLSIALAVFLVGCSTANYTIGTPINAENVKEIEHGKTTKADLLALFGEPFSKTPLTSTQEKWIYTYVNTTAKAQSYIVTMKVDSQSEQQTLDIIIEDGVVVNHTFVNRPIHKIDVN